MSTPLHPRSGRPATSPGPAGKVVAALVVGLVALSAGCSADRAPDGDGHVTTVTAAPPGKVRAPSPGTTGSAGTAPSATAGASPGSAPSGGTSGSAPSPGTSSGSSGGQQTSGTGSASEVLPPTAPAPGALVVPPAAGPRLTGPMPATASARGRLVAGFPVEIVPVPTGATVVSSSVSAEGNRLQVGLEASTGASPADVLTDYVRVFTAAGFITTDSPAGAGATATEFVRDNDGLVLTLRERSGGGTELSVAGTLTAQG